MARYKRDDWVYVCDKCTKEAQSDDGEFPEGWLEVALTAPWTGAMARAHVCSRTCAQDWVEDVPLEAAAVGT